MSAYRKKPVVIEAVRWTGDMGAVIGLVGQDLPTAGPDAVSGALVIATLEGRMIVRPGDWIIRGVQGEFYPCKPHIFDATYEPAGAAAVQEEPDRPRSWNLIPPHVVVGCHRCGEQHRRDQMSPVTEVRFYCDPGCLEDAGLAFKECDPPTRRGDR